MLSSHSSIMDIIWLHTGGFSLHPCCAHSSQKKLLISQCDKYHIAFHYVFFFDHKNPDEPVEYILENQSNCLVLPKNHALCGKSTKRKTLWVLSISSFIYLRRCTKSVLITRLVMDKLMASSITDNEANKKWSWSTIWSI